MADLVDCAITKAPSQKRPNPA